MKKFIITAIASVATIASVSGLAFTRCDTSSDNATFCKCYIANFKANCPQYLPAPLCANIDASGIKNKINQSGGADTSCRLQHDDPDMNDCVAATNHFLKHC